MVSGAQQGSFPGLSHLCRCHTRAEGCGQESCRWSGQEGGQAQTHSFHPKIEQILQTSELLAVHEGTHPDQDHLGGVLMLDALVEGQQGRLALASACAAARDAHAVAQVEIGHHDAGHRPIHPLQHLAPEVLCPLLKRNAPLGSFKCVQLMALVLMGSAAELQRIHDGQTIALQHPPPEVIRLLLMHYDLVKSAPLGLGSLRLTHVIFGQVHALQHLLSQLMGCNSSRAQQGLVSIW